MADDNLSATHFSDDEFDNVSVDSGDLDPDHFTPRNSEGPYRYPPMVDPSANPFGETHNCRYYCNIFVNYCLTYVYSAAVASNDCKSHMNPALPTVHRPGHAGSFGQGTSSKKPSGRVEPLPYYPLRRDVCHPYRSWLSGPGPARDLALLQAPPYVPPPRLKPTGGLIPESTADADTDEKITEEEESVVSDFYRSHLPRVTDSSIRRQEREEPRLPGGKRKVRGGRKQEQCDILELRQIVKRWKGLRKLPSCYQAISRKNIFIKRNDAPNPVNCVVDIYPYIQSVKPKIYPSNRLVKAERKQKKPAEKEAVRFRNRRLEDRSPFEDLSQYYQLPWSWKSWHRPQLIKEGKHGHGHSPHGCHSTHLHPSQCWKI